MFKHPPLKPSLQIPTNTTSHSWNTHLQSLTNSGRHHSALSLFLLMLRPPNPRPNSFTFPSALRSSAALSLPETTLQLHTQSLKSGCLSDPYVLTSLISAYSRRLSLLPLARTLLSEPSSVPSLVVCYNSLISGYTLHSLPSRSLSLFRDMVRGSLRFNSVTLLALLPSLPSPFCIHALVLRSGFVSDVSVSNSLLTSYGKSGVLGDARRVFDEIPERKRDLISYNAMISAYAQNGVGSEVLDLYYEIKRSGRIEPDPVTLVGVLSACANLGTRTVGRDVEADVHRVPRFSSNVYLKNALINMNARCGDLGRAQEIFDGMTEKTLISWTAIVAGYGAHGHGKTAVELFDRMVADGVRPDGVVMVSVLSACSHSGMPDKGMEYFSKMETEFGISPGAEHYACVVDLLGRSGRLKEAWELIRSMPVEPDGGVWGALLGACKIHKNMELGKVAFDRLVELEPTNVGYYVLMSNIYSDAGRLDELASVRAMMKKRGLKKDPGCSYVELKGKVHLFMADDHSHSQAESVYQMTRKLEDLVRFERSGDGKGREEESGRVIGFHSEKLAIAFGLLNTEAGVEIVVIKNLRVCEDCHLFIKLVSKIANRKVVVRDASRFHHFDRGVCSCSDYW